MSIPGFFAEASLPVVGGRRYRNTTTAGGKSATHDKIEPALLSVRDYCFNLFETTRDCSTNPYTGDLFCTCITKQLCTYGKRFVRWYIC